MNAIKSFKNAQKYKTDGFSHVLNILKLDVDIYHNAKVCGQWLLKEHRPGATSFHVVLTGNLQLNVPGYFKGVLNTGDLVLFPRELPHKMKPTTDTQGMQIHLPMSESQDIDGTGLLCGTVSFSHQASQFILDALPPVFVLRYTPKNYWLKSLLDMLIAENLNAEEASKVIINRLCEILFIYAIRQVAKDSPDYVGILALYGNSKLSRAIDCIHNQPNYEWTISELAKISAMSRTAYHETFKKISGWTSGQYLTWWRMQLAWTLLKNGGNISEVSIQVGYNSESAFSRIFQKSFGVSPGKVRREVILDT